MNSCFIYVPESELLAITNFHHVKTLLFNDVINCDSGPNATYILLPITPAPIAGFLSATSPYHIPVHKLFLPIITDPIQCNDFKRTALLLLSLPFLRY